MVRFDYLAKGLSAMSRAHRVSAMAGHLGAAVVAGYFISEQHPLLDPAVYRGIEGELDRIIRGESVFGPGKTSPITVAEMFAPQPRERPNAETIDTIAAALKVNIGETRESGHNVIFAALAIRALTDHPDFATPAVVEGIRKLIARFNGAKPGSGYFGKARGRIAGDKVPLPDAPAIPPYTDLPAMAGAVVRELNAVAGQRRDGFGGLWHVVNHAAALVELANYGYRDLARLGLPAHHRHLRLFHAVPDVSAELGEETPAAHDPRTRAFWEKDDIRRDRARLDHRIKTLYGFDALIDLVPDEADRKRARETFLYLM